MLPGTWPVPLDHLLHFIAHLSLSGKSASTARSYTSALASVHRFNSMDTITSHFLVQKAITGMARLSQRTDSRQPITAQLLSNIIQVLPSVCINSYEVSLFSAAFSLAFFGFCRVSEVVAQSTKDQSQKAVLLSDLSFAIDQSFIEVVLRTSKTDQQGRGTRISIQAIHNSSLCPVQNMSNFLSVRPFKPGYLFIHADSSLLTKFQFQAVLKKAIGATNAAINTNLYSSHSFRIGAATNAAMQGLSSDQIQVLGRWKSAAYKTYIRIPTLAI